MKTTFSSELIARAQKIFERRSGRAVSVEETEQHLEKLARIGLIAQELLEVEEQNRTMKTVKRQDKQ